MSEYITEYNLCGRKIRSIDLARALQVDPRNVRRLLKKRRLSAMQVVEYYHKDIKKVIERADVILHDREQNKRENQDKSAEIPVEEYVNKPVKRCPNCGNKEFYELYIGWECKRCHHQYTARSAELCREVEKAKKKGMSYGQMQGMRYLDKMKKKGERK